MELGVWRLFLLGNMTLGSKWVYKVKNKSGGSIECLKAQLMVLGNHYTETFAPVAKMVTVHTFLPVAAAKHWELHQMYVTILSCMAICENTIHETTSRISEYKIESGV